MHMSAWLSGRESSLRDPSPSVFLLSSLPAGPTANALQIRQEWMVRPAAAGAAAAAGQAGHWHAEQCHLIQQLMRWLGSRSAQEDGWFTGLCLEASHCDCRTATLSPTPCSTP